jgi:ribosomal protein S18 acetylase RimI-like enzyme
MNSSKLLLPTQSHYEIAIFDQSRLPSAQDLAKLHLTLLPNSPISLLGELFARSFYYKLLPKQGLIFGAVAYVDHQPVGFVVVTQCPNQFMQDGLRRNFLYLIVVIIVSILSNPIQRLAAIVEVVQIMKSLPTMAIAHSEAELLSFGVLPAYRFSQFGKDSGHHVAADLLHTIVEPIKAHGLKSVRAIVDMDNQAARAFYRKTGWQLRLNQVNGWRMASVELVWYLE